MPKDFGEIATEEGWTEATQVIVLLRYIENQDSDDAFLDFLEGQRAVRDIEPEGE